MSNEAQEIVNTIVADKVQPSNGSPKSAVTDESMDKFGRTAAERTIELEVDDAERVDAEVVDGKHQTFTDALHYIVERGVAEIKRQRESLRALKEQRNDANAMKALRTAVSNNPELMSNPTKLADVMKSLGIKLSK